MVPTIHDKYQAEFDYANIGFLKRHLRNSPPKKIGSISGALSYRAKDCVNICSNSEETTSPNNIILNNIYSGPVTYEYIYYSHFKLLFQRLSIVVAKNTT
jgi:hypothetical protein